MLNSQEFSKSYKKTDLAFCLKFCCVETWPLANTAEQWACSCTPTFFVKPKIIKIIKTLAKLAK
jgi:hypothetical protein